MAESAAALRDVLVALPKIALFADLPPPEIHAIARIVRRYRAPKGAVICAQGEVGEVAFFILEGRVDILITAADGRQFLLAELGPHEYFGEMALLDEVDRQRSATAVARADTELVLLRRADFLALLDQHPSIARRLLRSAIRRLRQANAQIAGLAFADVAGRLARALLALAEQGDDGRWIVRATHEELAGMIGAARQTVTRVLNTWGRHGTLATGREQLLLLQPAVLRAIAAGEE
jgi:CRP/FNR family cyclic AMP-dependent transcriptional regulator